MGYTHTTLQGKWLKINNDLFVLKQFPLVLRVK